MKGKSELQTLLEALTVRALDVLADELRLHVKFHETACKGIVGADVLAAECEAILAQVDAEVDFRAGGARREAS